MEIFSVFIDDGCITCDACEEAAPDVFEVTEDTCFIKPDARVFRTQQGKPSENTDFSDLKIIGEEIIPVDRVRNHLSQRLNIKFPAGETEPEDVDELMEIAKGYPGNCRLVFHLPNTGSPRPMKVMAHNIMISAESEFIKRLRGKYGKENVWVE